MIFEELSVAAGTCTSLVSKMEDSEQLPGEVSQLGTEADQEPETGPVSRNVGDGRGPVVSDVRINASSSAIFFGCASQTSHGSSSSAAPGLKRKEWKLLEEEYHRHGWLKPFPWMENCRFDPGKIYVPLTLDYFGRDGRQRGSVAAELETLFDCAFQEGAKRARFVLLRGEVGLGKTALCTKVVYEWRWHKTSIRALPWESTLIVLYNLRDFNSDGNLEDEIVRFLCERHSVDGKTEESTRKALRELDENLVLFLDGYDELDQVGKQKFEGLILDCKEDGNKNFTLSDASFLVTSRPTDRKDFLDLFEKHYSIGNLPRDGAKKLVSRYSQYCDKSKWHSGLELKEASPIILVGLCHVGENAEPDPLSLNADRNFQCVVLLARRCNHRDKLNLSEDEIKHGLIKIGQTCHKSKKHSFFVKEYLQMSLRDSAEFFTLATNMGILKPNRRGKELLRYDVINKALLKSLMKYSCQGFAGFR